MDNDQLICLTIITEVGNARSKYIEAIQVAKAGDYELCNQLMKDGNDAYAKGYRLHHDVVGRSTGEQAAEVSLLLIHAEDQLMSAESFKILCSEFIDVYRRFDDLEEAIT